MAETLFNTTPAEKGQFIVEYIYNYVIRKYDPAVKFKPITREKVSYGTPEECFIAHFSAMYAGDYEWWLSGWDKESQELLKEQDKKMNRTPDDWPEIWRKAMKDDEIKLIERVETGPYVFIVYKMFDQKGIPTFHSMLACRIADGFWKATQELARDPMFHHFASGKDRVKLNVR